MISSDLDRRRSSVALALAVLSERLGQIQADDRKELVEMATLFFGHADAEEREAAQRAILEILEPPNGRILTAEEWASAAPIVDERS